MAFNTLGPIAADDQNLDTNSDGVLSTDEIVRSRLSELGADPENLTNVELINEKFGVNVLVTDSDFHTALYANADESLIDTVQIYQSFSSMLSADMIEEKVQIVRDALKEQMPSQTEFIDTISDKSIMKIAKYSYDQYQLENGNPISGIAGGSLELFDNEGRYLGANVFISSEDTATWETMNGTALKYAGQEIDFPYDVKFRYLEIVAEEIEHATQHGLKTKLQDHFKMSAAQEGKDYDYGSTVGQLIELDGREGALSYMEDVVFKGKPEEFRAYEEFSSGLNQATTFHMALQNTAIQGDAGLMKRYAYELSRDALNAGQIIDPDQLVQTQQNVIEKILEPYGLETDEQKLAFVENGYMNFQEILTSLKELSMDEDLGPNEQMMVAHLIDSYEAIGIENAEPGAHLDMWQSVKPAETPAVPAQGNNNDIADPQAPGLN